MRLIHHGDGGPGGRASTVVRGRFNLQLRGSVRGSVSLRASAQGHGEELEVTGHNTSYLGSRKAPICAKTQGCV